MSVIAVEGLTKSFGRHRVVDGISLDLEEGEIVGFLGPNGSGKTTTMRLICGLLTLDAGGGQVLGYDLQRQRNRIRREIGYMTQRFSLYDDLTIAENLSFVARLYAMQPRRQVVDETLESLGLSHRRDQLAGQLSGGWRQRLALAACIMHRPRLLLLDEPTAGVDPKARRDFWGEIHRLADDGITVLVSTHYMDEAERCHRVACMSMGRLIAEGPTESVVGNSELTTFFVHAADPAALVDDIAALPGVEQVAPFGATLHVVGTDRALLEKSLAGFSEDRGCSVTPGETSLEDVFIRLINEAEEVRP